MAQPKPASRHDGRWSRRGPVIALCQREMLEAKWRAVYYGQRVRLSPCALWRLKVDLCAGADDGSDEVLWWSCGAALETLGGCWLRRRGEGGEGSRRLWMKQKGTDTLCWLTVLGVICQVFLLGGCYFEQQKRNSSNTT
jgi:hypothetical protein